MSDYPTIERLADLTSTTVGYQGPVLVEEAVRCWHELSAAQAELNHSKNCTATMQAAAEKARAERDALREDAGRWRHALEHGFPVRNQTAYSKDSLWVAHPGPTLGETPNAAIDAARGRDEVPPAVLANALQDKIHNESGETRTVKATRGRDGKEAGL